MKNKTLYIIIAILVLLNIGQFVYFYSVVSDLKSELKIMKNNGKFIFDPRYPNRYKI